MIKLAGLFGIVISFGLAGVGMSEELRERIRLLEEMQNLIAQLKGHMNYFRDPMYQIFQTIEKKGNSRAFLLPGRVLLKIKEKSGEMDVIWAETVKEIYEDTPLTDEDRKILIYMGTYLGQSDYENQLMQFQCTEERLNLQLNQARESYSKKGAMYRKAGFLAGALAAVILL